MFLVLRGLETYPEFANQIELKFEESKNLILPKKSFVLKKTLRYGTLKWMHIEPVICKITKYGKISVKFLREVIWQRLNSWYIWFSSNNEAWQISQMPVCHKMFSPYSYLESFRHHNNAYPN